MKKNCQKGFMLAETLIVSTFIVGVLLIMFVQLRNISSGYKKSLTYNTVNALYAATNMREFLISDKYEDLIKYYQDNFSLDTSNPFVYLDLTSCPTDLVDEIDYCNSLVSTLKIKTILFTDETNEYLLRFLDEDISLSKDMKNFIKYQKTDGEASKYRIYLETTDGEFASIKVYYPLSGV